MKLLLLHGPNLNLLGERPDEHYGSTTLAELEADLRGAFPEMDWDLFQSNHEGALIDRIQAAHGQVDGAIINPGGLSHSSISLLDAMQEAPFPFAEVHLSQVLKREEFRRNLLTAKGAGILLCGMGTAGYHAAARWFQSRKIQT